MKHRLILFLLFLILIVVILIVARFIGANMMHGKITEAVQSNDMIRLEKLCKNPISSVNFPYAIVDFWSAITDSTPLDYPLETAIQNDNVDAVKILLEHGAKPNKKHKFSGNKTGCLEMAIAFGNTEIVQTLLEHGAKTDFAPRALGIYVQNIYNGVDTKEGFSKMYQLLVENDILEENEKEKGELFLTVARYNHLEIAEYLMDCQNYSVQYHNSDGQTALHICCKSAYGRGKYEFAEYLLAKGIDPKETDTFGKTAYDYAVENGYTELAELLKP